jgi:hypothetical protein
MEFILSRAEWAQGTLFEKKRVLKKQSQFAAAITGAKPFAKGDYGNKPTGRDEKNKANQSQTLAFCRKFKVSGSKS